MNQDPTLRRDPASTVIEPYEPQTLFREWGEEIFFAETARYLGKILKMHAGTKGGLQYHVEKDETEYLLSGRALLRYDDGDGTLVELDVHPGESVHIPPGAVHQFEALEDCIFLEASTPHYDDRVRVEAEYGLTDEGGLPTTRAPR